MNIGDTFRWKDGGHLWVVVSDPTVHNGTFIAVNVTHDVFRAGRECELSAGEHERIKDKSYVSFGDAMKIGPEECLNLEKAIASGTIQKPKPVSKVLLLKIVTAAKKSKSLSPDFVHFL